MILNYTDNTLVHANDSSETGLLFSRESILDRSSPDLWPERIPGVTEFIAQNSPFNTPTTRNSVSSRPNSTARVLHPQNEEVNQFCGNVKALLSEWNRGLDTEDLNSMQGLSSLTPNALLEEVRKLEDRAYQLGLEESREMTRGKFLDVLSRNDNRIDINLDEVSHGSAAEENGGSGITDVTSNPCNRKDLR